MTSLPGRGFNVGGVTPEAKRGAVRKAMSQLSQGGPVPAGPRKAIAHQVAAPSMSPSASNLAPKMMKTNNPPHKSRMRAKEVAPGGGIVAPGGYPGFPSSAMP